MLLAQFAVLHHIRTGCAEIAGGPRIFSIASQQLHFYGNRKVLVLSHARSRLPMHHDAAVPICPARTLFTLFTHKAILQSDSIIPVGCIVKQMPEALVEGIILIITHYNLSLLHTESVAPVLACSCIPDLGRPPLQILSIENRYPLLFVRFLGACYQGEEQEREGEEVSHVECFAQNNN